MNCFRNYKMKNCWILVFVASFLLHDENLRDASAFVVGALCYIDLSGRLDCCTFFLLCLSVDQDASQVFLFHFSLSFTNILSECNVFEPLAEIYCILSDLLYFFLRCLQFEIRFEWSFWILTKEMEIFLCFYCFYYLPLFVLLNSINPTSNQFQIKVFLPFSIDF